MSIEIKNVSKNFKKTKALDGVSVKIDENKIYGLLGRNGAGKSTLLNLISNRLFADSGNIYVDGEETVENDKAQSKLFLMSETDMYPEYMTTKDIIKWTAQFYPGFDADKAHSIAAQFGLDEKKRLLSLSTGYKTIAKFVAAIASNAKYTFLDEPVLGLDANHRELLYKILLEDYSKEPRTFVIATHLIEEVAGVLEEVVIMNLGKILECDSTDNLLSKGYTITGPAQIVDDFIKDKNVIGTDMVGSVKIAYILGHNDIHSIPDGLEITGLNLQKLFIVLTDEKEALK